MLVDSSILMILSFACQSICTSQSTWINYVFLIIVLLEMLIFFFALFKFSALVSKTGKILLTYSSSKQFFSAFGLSLYTQTNDDTVFRNRIIFFPTGNTREYIRITEKIFLRLTL